MKSVRLEKFRCFHSKQSVPLAPLTLLVGENSTGKTSFMALIHAMIGIMAGDHPSRSWKDTFAFGNFDQIAYNGEHNGDTNRIEAGFNLEFSADNDLQCDFAFEPVKDLPFSVTGKLKYGDVWTLNRLTPEESDSSILEFGTLSGQWQIVVPGSSMSIWPSQLLQILGILLNNFPELASSPSLNLSRISKGDRDSLLNFQSALRSYPFNRSFAGAPIRSKPLRTYDPISSSPDSEGGNNLLYLAELSRGDEDAWERMHANLQSFGQSAGLFDEIIVRNYGGSQNDPFQVQVKEFIEHDRGHYRNLVDVGYGVSQILPVVTELLRRKQTPLFLLQQPEVHLHPSAQAALGSFFCDFAAWNRQLIVETHSDHLIDRVRMDVRDKRSKLSIDDVLILFFERIGRDVKIHPIKFDEEGNVLSAPDSYRQFFIDETTRSIGL